MNLFSDYQKKIFNSLQKLEKNKLIKIPKKISSIPYVSKLINRHAKNIKNFRREIIISQIIRDLINFMVVDVINTTSKNLMRINPQSINDIYQQDRLIVDFSDKMKKIDKQIKEFLKHNMYNHKKVITSTNKGKKNNK